MSLHTTQHKHLHGEEKNESIGRKVGGLLAHFGLRHGRNGLVHRGEQRSCCNVCLQDQDMIYVRVMNEERISERLGVRSHRVVVPCGQTANKGQELVLCTNHDLHNFLDGIHRLHMVRPLDQSRV